MLEKKRGEIKGPPLRSRGRKPEKKTMQKKGLGGLKMSTSQSPRHRRKKKGKRETVYPGLSKKK